MQKKILKSWKIGDYPPNIELSHPAIGLENLISKTELTVDELLNCIEKMVTFKFRQYSNYEMVVKLGQVVNVIEDASIKEAIFSFGEIVFLGLVDI